MGSVIFIGYRRADTDAFAGRLYDRLDAAFPGQVFLDVEEIEPGADFDEVLRSRVRDSKVVLVLIGPRWQSSVEGHPKLGDPGDYVTVEIRAALDAGVALIPVLIGGAAMPSSAELPEQLKTFALRNAVRLTHDNFKSDVEPLIASLYDYLGFVPQTPYERFMESLPLSWGAKWNEKMRDYHAILAAGFGALVVFAASLQLIYRLPGDLPSVLLPLGGVYCAWIGKNSKRRRKWAITGLVLCLSAMVFEVVYGVANAPSLTTPPLGAGDSRAVSPTLVLSFRMAGPALNSSKELSFAVLSSASLEPRTSNEVHATAKFGPTNAGRRA